MCGLNCNKIQIKDIVDYYEGIQAKINQEFYRDKNREEYIAGKDFLETKEKMKAAENAAEIEGIAKIGIEDFAKVDLRVAEIVDCEPVKKAKKLLKLTVFDGAGNRTVASGIAKWYKPEDLIGKKIILVSNLKPATLCGIESQGMILAADCSEDDVKVIFVDGIPAGSKVR